MESERRGDPEGCSGEGNGVREGGSGLCSPASHSSFLGYRPCGHARNLGSGWMNALLSGLRDRTRRGRWHPVPSGLFSAHHRSAGQTGCWAWQPRGPAGAGSLSSSSGLSGPLPTSSVSLLPFLGSKRMGSCRELRLSRCSWRAARLGLSGPPCSGPARRRAGVTRVLCAPLTHFVPSPQAARASMTRHPCGWSRCAPRTRAGTSARCSCWTSSTTPSTTAAGCTSPSTVRAWACACACLCAGMRVCVRASERADVRGACLRDCARRRVSVRACACASFRRSRAGGLRPPRSSWSPWGPWAQRPGSSRYQGVCRGRGRQSPAQGGGNQHPKLVGLRICGADLGAAAGRLSPGTSPLQPPPLDRSPQ